MNILFVTATRIGDAVLTTGLLERLVERHPDARVTVACGPAAVPLFTAAPRVVKRIPMVKRKNALHWLALWRACCTTWWDLIVDFRGSALAYLLPGRRRRVYRRRPDRGHRLRELAAVLGFDTPPPPRLWTNESHERYAADLIADERPVLAVGPTANWRGKTWPAENFAALIARLTAMGRILPQARVAILGAESEREMARPVLDAVEPAKLIDLVGKVDLLTAAAVLRRCALYVGNDSGLMHLAAATGVPTVGLFGPSREEHYAPWGERTTVVRTAIPYERLFPPGYDHRSTDTLMESLGVDAAEAAAVALWRRCAVAGSTAHDATSP